MQVPQQAYLVSCHSQEDCGRLQRGQSVFLTIAFMYKGIWIILAVLLSCTLVAIVFLDISGNYTWTNDALHILVVASVILGIVRRVLVSKKSKG